MQEEMMSCLKENYRSVKSNIMSKRLEELNDIAQELEQAKEELRAGLLAKLPPQELKVLRRKVRYTKEWLELKWTIYVYDINIISSSGELYFKDDLL